MILNKIELTLPTPDKEDSIEDIEQVLIEQTQQLVQIWRGVLESYKAIEGLKAPALSVRVPDKYKTKKEPTELQKFTKRLVDYHMERVPTAHSGKMRQIVQRLYEDGHTDADALIKEYEKCLEQYPATTWFTVRYWMNNKKAETEKEEAKFTPTNLDEEAVNELRKRITTY